jgi:hypothetical protein
MAGIYGNDVECSGYIVCICLQPDKGRTVRLVVVWMGAVKEQIEIMDLLCWITSSTVSCALISYKVGR